MRQGPSERIIVEQARKTKMPLPNIMKNKPSLAIGLDFMYKAFRELSTDRDIGMAEGPIPWSSMNAYATRHDIVDFDYFVLLMQLVDVEYLGERAKKSKGKKNKPISTNQTKAMAAG
jgi:hypothetical protein